MATTSFVGGRLRVTHSDAYRASAFRTRSIDRTSAGDIDALLVNTLRRNGFDAVHRVVVGPDRAKSRDVGAGQGTSVSLSLDVATDEDAVVLLEHEGCYTWLRPRHEISRDPQVIGRVAVFEFVVPPAGTATRDLGGLPAGAARATVLSYASPLLSRAAIRALELFVDSGLVHIAGVDPAEWRHVGSLADTGLSPDRNSRVLLLVHGTFDSTVGAFGALAATAPGRDFLTQALGDYDAVVGFDHKTLSVDPLENARELAALLTPFRGRQVTLDVICHSRGGLTARSFVESVLPGLAWRGKVDRAVFVGATNAGTHFADETRWADLADVYTNLVAANARAIAALPGGAPIAALVVGAVRGIGALVRWLASYATDPDSVPGIAAMVPDGPFVTEINKDQHGQPRSGTPWFVVSSDFEVTVDDHPPELPAAVVARLVDGVVDQVITGPNDLVVDDESMSAIDLEHGGGYVRSALALPANSTVYHTNYFTQESVCRALGAWLVQRVDHLEGEERAAPVPDTGGDDGDPGWRGPTRGPSPVVPPPMVTPPTWPAAGRLLRAAADDGRASARRLVRRATAHDRRRTTPTAGARTSGAATGDRPDAYCWLDPGHLRRRAPSEPAGRGDHDVAGPGVAYRPRRGRRDRVGANRARGTAGQPGRRPGHPQQERRPGRPGPRPAAAAAGRRLVGAAVRGARRGSRPGEAESPGPPRP